MELGDLISQALQVILMQPILASWQTFLTDYLKLEYAHAILPVAFGKGFFFFSWSNQTKMLTTVSLALDLSSALNHASHPLFNIQIPLPQPQNLPAPLYTYSTWLSSCSYPNLLLPATIDTD